MTLHGLLIEAIGYLAAAASVFVYVSNTMIPLRIGAILANALFALYFFLKGLYPLFALNAFLVPVNMLRLRQMQRLVQDIRAAASEDFDFE
ncbi:MAG: cyclic nucleotide-binding domain-containing protein, partial [Methylocystis sp.]